MVNVHLYRISDWSLQTTKQKVPHRYMYKFGNYDYLRGRVVAQFDSDSTLTTMRNGFIDVPGLDFSYVPHALVYPASKAGVIHATAQDTDGLLYAIDENGILWRQCISNSVLTKVGDTKLGKVDYSGAFIDPLTHNLYFAAYTANHKSSLYIIDKNTAAATHIWDIAQGDVLTGLFIPNRPLALEKAPVAPSELKWTPVQNTALEGKISFKAPVTNFDGSPLVGEMNYAIVVDADTIKSGKIAAGAVASTDYTFPKNWYYNVRVSVSNTTGASPYTVMEYYMGQDCASAPGNATLVSDGTNLKLNWEAPTTTEHGGQWKPEDLTYDIIRYPGKFDAGATAAEKTSLKVATDVKGTAWQEAIPAHSKTVGYYYTIIAKQGGTVSHPCYSDTLVLGNLTLPYYTDFKDQQEASSYRVYNMNGDYKTWYWMSSWDGAFCNENSHMPKNEWLISLGFHAELGKVYKITYDISSYTDASNELLQIMGGMGLTPADMSVAITDTMAFGIARVANGKRFLAYFTPTATGNWNLGFHAVSPLSSKFMYLYNLGISEGTSATAPKAVTAIKFRNDDSKTPCGTLSFKAPTVSFQNQQLTGKVSVKVLRGDSLIKTLTNLTPGQEVNMRDTVSAKGVFTYHLISQNDAGEGEETMFETFVGVNIPGLVTELKGHEIPSRPGYVELSWAAPEVDADNHPFDTSMATYRLVNTKNNEVLIDNIKETSITYKVCEPEDLANWYNFGIITVSSAGASKKGVSISPLSVGKPLEMPFIEPFSGVAPTQNWIRSSFGNTTYAYLVDGQATDSQNKKVYSENGDQGLVGFRVGSYSDEFWGAHRSLKIKITGEHPEMSIWGYCSPGCHNPIDLMVNETGYEAGWKVIKTVELDADKYGWKRFSASLEEYKGKVIQVCFRQRCENFTMNIVDHFAVDNVLSKDLYAGRFNFDYDLTPDKSYKLMVPVTNIGLEPASGYTLSVVRDGSLVTTLPGVALNAGETREFTCDLDINNGMSKMLGYKAYIDWKDDMRHDNDTTAEQRYVVNIPDLPRIMSLKGVKGESNVSLNWGAADLSIADKDTVETFENFPTFSIGQTGSEVEDDNLGKFITVDRDGKTPLPLKIGSKTYTFPNCTKPFAFATFNSTLTDPKISSSSYKGQNSATCLISLAVDGQKDDWLISPELTGLNSEIKISCRSTSASKGLEVIQLYYSTGSTNPDDFIALTDSVEVPNAWFNVTLDIPYGAKRFAIRAMTNGGTALLVDNFKYVVPDSRYQNLKLSGYNIYRNGIKLNSALLNARTYTDASADTKIDNYYTVTSVFDRGESGASNVLKIDGTNSLSTLTGDALRVGTDGRNIVVDNATDGIVYVYNAQGFLVTLRQPAHRLVIPVEAPGIYLVCSTGKSVKLMVK